MPDLFDLDNIPEKILVRVTPKAKRAQIQKAVAEDGSVFYKIYITEVPEDGKANKAVIKALSKALKISKSSLSISHGLTCRDKVVLVNI